MGLQEGPTNVDRTPINIVKTLFVVAIFIAAMAVGVWALAAEPAGSFETIEVVGDEQVPVSPDISDGPDVIGLCIGTSCRECTFGDLNTCDGLCNGRRRGRELIATACEVTIDPSNYVQTNAPLQRTLHCGCGFGPWPNPANMASPWIDGL